MRRTVPPRTCGTDQRCSSCWPRLFHSRSEPTSRARGRGLGRAAYANAAIAEAVIAAGSADGDVLADGLGLLGWLLELEITRTGRYVCSRCGY